MKYISKRKFKFMSFKGGKNIMLNSLIILGFLGLSGWAIKGVRASRSCTCSANGASGRFMRTVTRTATNAGYPKYTAPPSAQQPATPRMSVAWYTTKMA